MHEDSKWCQSCAVFSGFSWCSFMDVTISSCSSATWHVLSGFLQKYQIFHWSVCVLLRNPIWKTHFPGREFFKSTAGCLYSNTDKALVNILKVQRYFQIRDGFKKFKRPFCHIRISWLWFLHYSNINHNCCQVITIVQLSQKWELGPRLWEFLWLCFVSSHKLF